MSETLAVEVLYAAVVARFVAENVGATNTFGWRTPEQYAEGNRIAWVPGDPNGVIGVTGPARNSGAVNPRSLGTLRELFTCVISASDATDPENELLQYKAVRVLRDLWFRAVYKAAHGTFQIRDEKWITTKNERRYGAALRVVVELEAKIPDIVRELAPVDTTANIDVQLQLTSDPPDVIDPGDGDVDTGEGGTGGTVKKYVAGENLSALRVVRFEPGVPNSVVLVRPPEPESVAPLGITSTAAASGDDVNVVVDGGELTDSSWAWVTGSPVLLAELGTLTQTPSPGVPFVLVIGIATAPDTIAVRIEPAIFTA